jgi:hypothetical protein
VVLYGASLQTGSTLVDGESDPGAVVAVFFSSRALLKITVKPSADAGSFTSHSPNLGNGPPAFSYNNLKEHK